ncbi:hypothetical protein BDN72DRAFT_408574 [Pluteus cervinus]|uniref:Uncharacterized protein n=1 Tax=Pluteus cervinus TaxID=181527 RepID=A0ACD3B1M1_9AGAR|nr:hypothetical protein BDN72DRAFT_408574 [Pluteus cervinus]
MHLVIIIALVSDMRAMGYGTTVLRRIPAADVAQRDCSRSAFPLPSAREYFTRHWHEKLSSTIMEERWCRFNTMLLSIASFWVTQP